MKTAQSVHWNGHLLCSIDIETTGLDPEKDEILEIAIIPLLPTLKPNGMVVPFETVIRPEFPERWEDQQNPNVLPGMKLSEVLLHGIEKWSTVDLLIGWKEKLNLPERKKIIPLGHNYSKFDRPFLRHWMGAETYDYLFDYHERDTMQIGLYLNDLADMLGQPCPFPKVGLTYMCSCLKIENPRRHRAGGDAWACAKLYRELVTRVMPNYMAASKLSQSASDAPETVSEPLPESVHTPQP